ncbi:M56 family metallopeptidase [Neolewinella sp.]|uniref:M56 family metallopeptidase n=1 Tax=Neolewinella sp. TaxID=2993543 RepID=UPI003B529883
MSASLIHTLLAVLATALLHSLWLFIVVTGLGYLLAGTLKEARHRYVAYLMTLLALPLTFGTLLLLAWWDATGNGFQAGSTVEGLGSPATLLLTDGLSQSGLSLHWMDYLALAYLVGLTLFAGVRSYQYGITLRLRNGGDSPGREWMSLFDRVSAKVVPGREVRWKITARVRQVLVVGVFRPVILFPIGLLATLTPAEVEAILLHELHHVRRYDVLWNSVELLIVSLFFYHPLVYWLARRLDREREYGCDDAASASTGQQTYARALVRVARFSLPPTTTYTMSAVDPRTLTSRVQRLFGATTSPDRSNSSLLLLLVLLPLCLLLAFCTPDTDYAPTAAESNATTPTEETIISGTVTDAETGETLIGTSILVQNTKMGTISDLEGNFTIAMPDGAQHLVFSYVGYQTSIQATQLNQDADRPLNVQLVRVDEDKEVGGTEVTVRGDNGQLRDSTIFDQGLSGNVLILLDGKRIERAAMADLAPDRITQVTVVKDKEELAALGYGEAFSGAILITTK